MKHGKDCHKMEHRVHPDDQGYLHAQDDDAPYDVDGQLYCGRCHYAIDSPDAIIDTMCNPNRLEPVLSAVVTWLDKTADINDELASRTTWRGNAYNRGYSAGLRVAANELKKLLGRNPYTD